MGRKEEIVTILKKEKGLSGTQLADRLGLSRQAVNRHLKTLMQDGAVVKEGVTRGAVYRPASIGEPPPPRVFRRILPLDNLEEDAVFRDLSLALHLEKETSRDAAEIARYAFTEILNNAIDHSESPKCMIEAHVGGFNFQFTIRDYGIGIFYSVFNKFNLTDEYAAIGEIIKGKTTTMAEKHSGEGIFFTSKAADFMEFRSHRIRLVFDNERRDIFVEERKNITGTEVCFRIKKRSRKKIADIFAMYSPEEFDYKFEKTRAMVKLFQTEYISRSEARRLLHGLDRFTKIILDFKGVRIIGQGFADEIFRVFMRNHPDISVKVENLGPVLQPVIEHVVDKKTKNKLTIG